MQRTALVDDRVGAGEQHWRKFKAERLRRSEIDDEIELGRLHDWQVGGLLGLKNAAGIDSRLAIYIRHAGPVGHEPTRVCELTHPLARAHPTARRHSRYF